MGSKAKKSGLAPKGKRRGRKLFVLGVIGLAAAAFKATREDNAPAPAAPAPAPARTEPESAAIERLETESPAVPDVEPVPVPEAVATPDPLPEPVIEATEDLHDIVEEPWADSEVVPATEPPVDSLTSFFDEVMTDTAERKLRNET